MTLVDIPPGGAGEKLPLGRTIGRAYSSYFANFIDVLRIEWLWLIVVGPLTGFGSWLQLSWMASVLPGLRPGESPGSLRAPFEISVLNNAATITLLLAGVCIAVAWHRRLLLDEAPGFSGSNVATGHVWRYIGMAMLIVLITAWPAVLIFIAMYFMSPFNTGVPQPPSSQLFYIILAALILFCVGMVVAQRLSILLPARAIGDMNFTMKQAWARTRGNTWRIFWGYFVCTLPPMILAQVIWLISMASTLPGRPAFGPTFVRLMTIFGALMSVYYLLILPLAIGFLSHAYRHFFPAVWRPVESSTRRDI